MPQSKYSQDEQHTTCARALRIQCWTSQFLDIRISKIRGGRSKPGLAAQHSAGLHLVNSAPQWSVRMYLLLPLYNMVCLCARVCAMSNTDMTCCGATGECDLLRAAAGRRHREPGPLCAVRFCPIAFRYALSGTDVAYLLRCVRYLGVLLSRLLLRNVRY
eukprot:1516976-Rhodomonas_salina.1